MKRQRKPSKSAGLDQALERLAAAEQEFLQSEFLAPALQGGEVNVRIAGVVCRLQVQPADFAGWGVFRPKSHTEAALVRPARLVERQRYLELFPLVRFIFAGKLNDLALALPAHSADSRFRIEGLVPLRLIEDDVQLFEVVHARFDGSQFWYQSGDPQRDPAAAAFLRQALEKMRQPDKLIRPGLTAEERKAYATSYWPRYEASEEARRSREENRVRRAVAHAGAEFKEYRERGDVYTVTFEVDGQRHVSVVSKADLAVQVAGICLSGEDENFDLQSLVGVIREAQGGGGFVRIGQENRGMAEEQYWRVHPRRRR
ncbi:MAG: hypothetical protein L0215_19135 [Gemmataceae bacterium]|nr:hypothetical protein [Gemmataceae bacterium]